MTQKVYLLSQVGTASIGVYANIDAAKSYASSTYPVEGSGESIFWSQDGVDWRGTVTITLDNIAKMFDPTFPGPDKNPVTFVFWIREASVCGA